MNYTTHVWKASFVLMKYFKKNIKCNHKVDLLFKDEKVQYSFNRELALLPRKTDKIENLTCGEALSSA